jgi:hypothetical protein
MRVFIGDNDLCYNMTIIKVLTIVFQTNHSNQSIIYIVFAWRIQYDNFSFPYTSCNGGFYNAQSVLHVCVDLHVVDNNKRAKYRAIRGLTQRGVLCLG